MTESVAIRRAWPADTAPESFTLHDGWSVRAFQRRGGGGDAKGSILCQGGRGDFLEKYLECLAHWHDQGWNVAGFDWRGQGGSGRFLADRSVGHVGNFAQWIDDLAEYYAHWQATTSGPHIVVGHSMGGHLVLRALIEKRIAPDGVVLVSPMLGFETGPLPVAVSAWLVRWAARLGRAEKPAWKANERPGANRVSRQKFLTHDADRYADELWWRAENPELALGPPSIHWLIQAQDSNLRIAQAHGPESVAVPMLILGADTDKLVSPQAIRRVAARLPKARLRMFGEEAAHELLRETDAVRDVVLNEIDAFIDTVAVAR